MPRRRPGTRRPPPHRPPPPRPRPRRPRPGPRRARDAQAAPLLAQDQETAAAPVTSAPAPAHPASPWFPVDPDSDTQPIAAISAPISGPVKPAGIKPVFQPERGTARLPATKKPAGWSRRRLRAAGVIATVLVLLGSGSLAFALSRHTAGRTTGDARRIAASGQAPVAQAASWVARQVSVTAVVACDPATCRAMRAGGVPAARLRPVGPDTTGPLRADVIVATAPVRARLGGRLPSVYAPAVIASFGSGRLRIDIRVVAANGAAAYRSALRADVQARKAAGAILLRSQRVIVSAAARSQLAGGRVDTRLLVAIAAWPRHIRCRSWPSAIWRSAPAPAYPSAPPMSRRAPGAQRTCSP